MIQRCAHPSAVHVSITNNADSLTEPHFGVTVCLADIACEWIALEAGRMSRIIYICWAIGILSAALSPLPAMPGVESIHIPFGFGIIMLAMPIAFFSFISVCGPAHSPFYHQRIAAYVDSRYGALAFESFLVKLKPLLLFGIASFVQGLTTLWQSPLPHIFPGVLFSAGLALVFAHFILLRRQAVGVYLSSVPAADVESRRKPIPTKQPLTIALRLYWWCLIGVFLLPTMMTVGEVYKVPFEFFIPLFFAVMFLAMWPVLSQRASYAFWLVAVVLWLGGAFLAAAVMRLVLP
jgi:hypothetical protein